MTLREFITEGKKRLETSQSHYSDAHQHMEQLVLRTLGWTPAQILLKLEDSLSESEINRLSQVLERRLQAEPLQYILGYEWFYKSRFEVGEGCLIPRKETEQLVDEILKFRPKEKIKIAELGAGTGNIGISVILERPHCEWYAFELNPKSFLFAQRNKQTLLPSAASYSLSLDDFFEGSKSFVPYDIIVSNPPYISDREMLDLPQEVKREPALALEAGVDGLSIIRRLLDSLPHLLKSQGLFLCEIGSTQEKIIREEMERRGFKDYQILPDLAGLPRVLKLCKRSSE
jgi:release factor glutamine methyltransferase